MQQDASLAQQTIYSRTAAAMLNGGFSPVPVPSRAEYDIDIGASPQYEASSRPLDQAAAVDFTTELSDVSADVSGAAVEARLAELDAVGSAAVLGSARSPRAGAMATHHLHHEQHSSEDGFRNAIPIAKPLSLAAALEGPKPVVAVNFELSEGCFDYVTLYDNDTRESCDEHAAAFLRKHGVSEEAVDKVSAHLWLAFQQYYNPTSRLNVHAATRSASPTVTGSVGVRTKVNTHRDPASMGSQGDPCRPVKTFSQRRGVSPTKGNKPSGGSGEPRRSTSASRSQHFADVQPRYLSPVRKVDPPPPPTFPHAPELCKRTIEIAAKTAHNVPVHDRLYKTEEEWRQHRKAHAHMQRLVETAKPKVLDHHVKGLNWDIHNTKPFGERLYKQATLQQQRVKQKALEAERQRTLQEMEGVSFQPVINASLEHHQQQCREPISAESRYAKSSPAAAPTIKSSEELELEECTFRPRINERRVGSQQHVSLYTQQANSSRSSAGRPTTPSNPSDSGMRRLASQPRPASVSPMRKYPGTRSSASEQPTPASKRSSSATRGASPSKARVNVETLTERLFREAKERAERLSSAKKRLDTIDPKTGRPLFKPFTGR